MEFGKFSGFGNLGTIASLSSIGGKSNSFLIWVLLAILVFGFGKGRSVFESAFVQYKIPEGKRCSRRHYKPGGSVPLTPLAGLGGVGMGGAMNPLMSNAIFILIVLALFFLCKDEKETDKTDGYISAEEIIEE